MAYLYLYIFHFKSDAFSRLCFRPSQHLLQSGDKNLCTCIAGKFQMIVLGTNKKNCCRSFGYFWEFSRIFLYFTLDIFAWQPNLWIPKSLLLPALTLQFAVKFYGFVRVNLIIICRRNCIESRVNGYINNILGFFAGTNSLCCKTNF